MKQHFRISGLTGRLRLIVALLTLGLGAAMVIVILYLQEVHARASKADTVRVLQLADIASVELNVTRVSLQLRHAMLARTPAERQAAMDDITLKRKLIDEALGDYERRLYSAEGRRRFVPVPGLVAEFWRVGGENAALIQEGRVDDAFAFLVDRTIPARNALLNVLDETVDYQRRALGADIARIEALVRRTLLLLGTLVVATVLSLGLFAWWLGRRLYDRVGHTIQFASRVRDGDLSEHPKDAVRDEFTPLLRALEDMRVSLSTVVRGVRDGAQQVVDVTAGVTEGNSNLARRTVDQGRELQSTAINMAELSRTVQDNADQSTQAAHVADEATRVAGRGGEIMGSVVTSMRGISDTSRRIGDIIGTIDAIAFQTNILAINASVEAARAGSQGRGFAVVAGEVRSLAQRSGEAAREIKQLIGSSMEAVDEGARLVEEAGRTMSAIVDSIQRVQSLVGGINEASQAQRQGIAEVGASVRSLDEVTRENTALVNSAAESAQSVLDQARELVAHVSAFRLGGDDGSSPSGAPAVRGHRQRTDHVGMDPVPRLLRLN